MGDGSNILVLEELEHALARGAKIYGEVMGYGATAIAYHVTLRNQPGRGAAKAMKFAMQEAGITPEQVGYINAHGTSTHANDVGETKRSSLQWRRMCKEHPDQFHKIYDRTFARCSKVRSRQ